MLDQFPCVPSADLWLVDGTRGYLSIDFREVNSQILIRKLKALTEIGFLTVYGKAGCSECLSNAVRDQLQQVISGEFLSFCRNNIEHRNLLMPLAYAAMVACGAPQNFRQDINKLVYLFRANSVETIPFRQLDAMHAESLLTGVDNYDAMLQLASRGCLARSKTDRIPPSQAYALTHTIFYLTDFGRKKWPEQVAAPEVVLELLSRLSDLARLDCDYDLMAEYIMSRIFIGEYSEELDDIRDELSHGMLSTGCWPSPVDLRKKLEGEGFSRSQLEFFGNYHTTIVANEALARNLSSTLPVVECNLDSALPSIKCPVSVQKSPIDFLADAFTEMSEDHEVDSTLDPIAEDLLTPNCILRAAELSYWCNAMGRPSDLLQSVFHELTVSDVEIPYDNLRVRFIWALCQLATGGSLKGVFVLDDSKTTLLSSAEDCKWHALHCTDQREYPSLEMAIRRYINKLFLEDRMEELLGTMPYVRQFYDHGELAAFEIYVDQQISLSNEFGWVPRTADPTKVSQAKILLAMNRVSSRLFSRDYSNHR